MLSFAISDLDLTLFIYTSLLHRVHYLDMISFQGMTLLLNEKSTNCVKFTLSNIRLTATNNIVRNEKFYLVYLFLFVFLGVTLSNGVLRLSIQH